MTVLEVVGSDTGIAQGGGMAGDAYIGAFVADVVRLVPIIACWAGVQAFQSWDVGEGRVSALFYALSVVVCRISLVHKQSLYRT